MAIYVDMDCRLPHRILAKCRLLLCGLSSLTKITFRTALAALASFVLAVLLGPKVIAWLRARFREPPCERSTDCASCINIKQPRQRWAAYFW